MGTGNLSFLYQTGKSHDIHTQKEKVEETKRTLIKFLFKEWLSLLNNANVQILLKEAHSNPADHVITIVLMGRTCYSKI